jgi:hypothetical protein
VDSDPQCQSLAPPLIKFIDLIGWLSTVPKISRHRQISFNEEAGPSRSEGWALGHLGKVPVEGNCRLGAAGRTWTQARKEDEELSPRCFQDFSILNIVTIKFFVF